MRLSAAICAASAVGLLFAAPSAQAAHVGFGVEQSGNGDTAATLVYAAAPGEQNDLSAGWDGGSPWTSHEHRAATVTGDTYACQTVDAHTVDCYVGPGSPNNGGP